jgi:hypothetical protein
MVSSSLEAGSVGALTAHAGAHLKRGPESPGPSSAHIGSVGCRRRDRRGARGPRRKDFSCWTKAAQFHNTNKLNKANDTPQTHLNPCPSLPLRIPPRHLEIPTAAGASHMKSGKEHPLECSRDAPTLPKLTAHHLLASYTHAHPSIHVTSIAVTHTHVCNTVSDTVPALT